MVPERKLQISPLRSPCRDDKFCLGTLIFLAQINLPSRQERSLLWTSLGVEFGSARAPTAADYGLLIN